METRRQSFVARTSSRQKAEIVDAVMSVYFGAKAAVKFNGKISDQFDLLG